MLSKIDRYNILGELGKGGMAVVYRAYDSKLGREVAVKVIRTDDSLEPSQQQELHRRLENEARAVAMLHHPGIVTIFDQGEFEGQAYIAMELIEGQTLGSLIGGNRLSIPQSLNILRDVAEALDFAHSKKVVHRDIKPANILVQPDGRAKITDFGIAKADVLAATRTATGMLIGSLHYMAPEQIEGKPCTPATDQWGLAVTAFECVSGRRPFESDSMVSLCRQICDKPAPAPTEFNPALPARVNECIAQALDKEPANRYTSCSEFVSTLAMAFQETHPQVQPAAISRPHVVPRPTAVSRSPIVSRKGIAAALLVVALAGAAVLATRWRAHSSERTTPVSVAKSIEPPQSPPSVSAVSKALPKLLPLPPAPVGAAAAAPQKAPVPEASKAQTKEVPKPTPRVAAPPALPKEDVAVVRPPVAKQPDAEELKNLVDSYVKNGLLARDQRDFGKAREWFLKAATAGNNDAMRNLGVLYQNGQGGAQDLGEAMKWYAKAADAGNSVAMFNIGRLYQSGLGVTQDNEEAKKWYAKAASMGFGDAKEMLRVLSTAAGPAAVTALAQNAQTSTPNQTKPAAPLPASPNVYRVGGGVSAPTVISKVDPEYTEEARAAKFNGDVLLYVEIGTDGQAYNFKVIRSLGLGLDEKAIEAVKKWKFKPGYLNGQPVRVGATIQVSFRLL